MMSLRIDIVISGIQALNVSTEVPPPAAQVQTFGEVNHKRDGVALKRDAVLVFLLEKSNVIKITCYFS